MDNRNLLNTPENMPFYRQTESASEQVYEIHDMQELPVIFHRDEVRTGSFCPTNWHENIEVLLVTEGEGTVMCEDEQTTVCAGDLCVIDSDLIHRVESRDFIRYFCLIVDNAFCRDCGLHPEQYRFMRRIRSNKLAEQYHNVAEAYLAQDEFRETAVRGELLRFMVLLCRDYRVQKGASTPHHAPDGIRRAITYVRTHYAEQIAMDDLAAVAGLSKYHFTREFKRVAGHSPVTYINMVRIHQASRMLEAGQTSVCAVAAACGFSTPSYFTKMFVRLRGMLPSEWGEAQRTAAKTEKG